MPNALVGFQQRETGALPISVGTSLAIEGLRVPKIPAYDYLWVNLRTLYRNLLQSAETWVRDVTDPQTVAEVLLDELEHIHDAVLTITGGRVKPQWYLSAPETLVKVLPDAIIRAPKTDLQKHVAMLCDKALDIVVNTIGRHNVMFFRPLLEGPGRTLCLTHVPSDLLSHRKFEELMLLESQTGTIKQYAQFNTKLSNGKELSNIPFNGFTLSIFGDNNVLLYQAPGKIRRAILEIATKYDWTPMTTRDKIRYGISAIRGDEFGKQSLLNMLSKTTY
jgi:hypothetical protein